ncbi:DUF3124 domain-containing protein [uncultured Roseibium sp.]|uniref:DUF3124 domain-containing protein n=1 Tax=uncultured Roseibium sp. TaxID=1936171 RepID=UPI0032169AE6
MHSFLPGCLIALLILAAPGPLRAEPLPHSLGETLYVPAYSRIQIYPNKSELLASTLAIHNVDPERAITVESAGYYDEAGNKLRDLIAAPVELAPFASTAFLIPVNDISGGIGANFVVTWHSVSPALSPIVEAIMSGAAGGPGSSFTSRGEVIDRQLPPQ